MLRIATTAFVIALVSASSVNAAQGQRVCGERAKLVEGLQSKYKEKPQAIGVSADGGLLEVFVSSTGSWTILVSYPERPTCVVTVGQGWRSRVVLAGSPA